MITVKFKGIDSWGRPVFKDTETNHYYGDTDTLFPQEAKELEVIEKVSAKNLVYFGHHFGCEPHGSLPLEIIRIVV